MADTSQMTQGDRFALYDAVRTSRSTTASPEQTAAAGATQKRLREKYPDIYAGVRGEIFEEVSSENYNKGGMVKKTKKMSRGGMPKKAAMMRGGMANGKQHMYAAGGSVTDNAGLRALKKASPTAYNKITQS